MHSTHSKTSDRGTHNFTNLRLNTAIGGIVGLLVCYKYENFDYRTFIIYLSIILQLYAVFLAFQFGRKNRFNKWGFVFLAWQLPIFLSQLIMFLADKFLISKISSAILAIVSINIALWVEIAFWHHKKKPITNISLLKQPFFRGIYTSFIILFFCLSNVFATYYDRIVMVSGRTISVLSEKNVSLTKQYKDMTIYVFVPKTFDYYPILSGYFTQLTQNNREVNIIYASIDTHPEMAKKLNINQNGLVVLNRGIQKEVIEIGEDLIQARDNLKNFDNIFQYSLLRITRGIKKIYFSEGHGELGSQERGNHELFIDHTLRTYLLKNSFMIKPWSITHGGSLQSIPSDADLVFVLGPSRSFYQEEMQALFSYLEKGGKLWFAFERNSSTPDSVKSPDSTSLFQMLERMGILFHPTQIINNKKYISFSKNSQDKGFTFTDKVANHPATYTIFNLPHQFILLFYHAGYLSYTEQKGQWANNVLVQSLDESYIDINDDLEFDQSEKKGVFPLLISSINQTTRAKVITSASSLIFSDFLFANPGHRALLHDNLAWLLDDFSLSADKSIGQEESKFYFSRQQDIKLFYATLFGLPGILLLLAFLGLRLNRTR